MDIYEPLDLEADVIKVHIMKNGVKEESSEIEVELYYFEDGQEGGEFNNLFVQIENAKEVIKDLNDGDCIVIEAFNSGSEMFEPIIINVSGKGDGKCLMFNNHITNGSWCFNLNEDWYN